MFCDICQNVAPEDLVSAQFWSCETRSSAMNVKFVPVYVKTLSIFFCLSFCFSEALFEGLPIKHIASAIPNERPTRSTR